jgi:hypothetical protein
MMNHNASLEDWLESLGAALRARPRLTGRVMDRVRESAADGSTAGLPTRTRHFTIRGHRRLVAASGGAVAMIGVAMLIAITLFPSQSAGWPEVTKAIQSQKWIRGTATFGTMWLAPERQIWAFSLNGSHYFNDGRTKAKYEYRVGDKAITKLPLGEDNAQRILPLDALSQDTSAIGPWLFGTEKIIEQNRREITEAGKTWIEFQMVLWRGEMNHVTLRVDPATRLPIYLLQTSPKDKTKSSMWEFDYPTDGPADIYALGVPKEVKIDDRMPPDNVQRVIDAMAASRARIGNFRLIVGQSASYSSSVVYRKGNRWRIDSWRPQVAIDSMPEASKEQDWGQWFEEQLQLSKSMPFYVCDGKSVWENRSFQPGEEPRWKLSQHTAPQDLMSGEGLGSLPSGPNVKIASLLFPDLSPKRGWGFEFDLEPADAPGFVLLKRSAQTTRPDGALGHEWFFVDPAKGYAVVRAELFTLPPDTPSEPAASQVRQTISMEDFHESPQGFWYPTVVHNTSHFAANNSRGQGAIQPLKTMVRYHFDFDADLPDSLFTIDDRQLPNK